MPRRTGRKRIAGGFSSTERASPQELEEVKVVKPEMLAKWRRWGVPEEIITRLVQQKELAREMRRVEEWITVPDFAYRMPRLPEIEAERWGFAKVIDTEGTIMVRERARRAKIMKVDRWVYRYEYRRPRIRVSVTDYDLAEEIANMMHVEVIIVHAYHRALRRWRLSYDASTSLARAIRICYLIEPYLVIPEKRRRARQIFNHL